MVHSSHVFVVLKSELNGKYTNCHFGSLGASNSVYQAVQHPEDSTTTDIWIPEIFFMTAYKWL